MIALCCLFCLMSRITYRKFSFSTSVLVCPITETSLCLPSHTEALYAKFSSIFSEDFLRGGSIHSFKTSSEQRPQQRTERFKHEQFSVQLIAVFIRIVLLNNKCLRSCEMKIRL